MPPLLHSGEKVTISESKMDCFTLTKELHKANNQKGKHLGTVYTGVKINAMEKELVHLLERQYFMLDKIFGHRLQ